MTQTEHHLIDGMIQAISYADMTEAQKVEEQKVKALFFSRYYGQKVLYYNHEFGTYKTCPEFGSFHTVRHVKEGYLLLRSVDKLTDDEKTTLGKLITGHIHESYSERQILEVAYRFINHVQTNKNFIYAVYEVVNAIDYLRSIGILTDFTFLYQNKPFTLPATDILLLGWANVQ